MLPPDGRNLYTLSRIVFLTYILSRTADTRKFSVHLLLNVTISRRGSHQRQVDTGTYII